VARKYTFNSPNTFYVPQFKGSETFFLYSLASGSVAIFGSHAAPASAAKAALGHGRRDGAVSLEE
jgi:hypothetical protein